MGILDGITMKKLEEMRQALEQIWDALGPDSELIQRVETDSVSAWVHGAPDYTGVTLADLRTVAGAALKKTP